MKKIPYKVMTTSAIAALLTVACSVPASAANGDYYYGDQGSLTRVAKEDAKNQKDILKANKDKLYYQVSDTAIVTYNKFVQQLVNDWANGSLVDAWNSSSSNPATQAPTEIKDEAKKLDTPVDGIKVDSVSAITKTSVNVKLDAAKADAKAADFTVKVGEKVVPVTAVKANTDNTVYTLTVALDGKEGKVNVNGKESDAFDFKAPEIAKITPVSDKVFDVTYSEDVNAGLAQIIGNYAMAQTGTANVVNMKDATVAIKDSKTVRITLVSGLTKDVEYTVTAKNIQDTSKNTVSATGISASFKAILDTEKPVIASAVAKDTDKIEVTMNKEMKTAPTASVQLIKADGTLDTAIANNTTCKDNVVTITLTDASKLMKNESKYRVTLTAGADMSNNPVADNQAVDVAGLSDEIAPTVVGLPTYDSVNKKVTINFSEPVENLEVLDNSSAKNFVLFETETGIQASGTITPKASDDKKSVVLTLQDALDGNKGYSIRLRGYDLSARTDGLMDSSKSKNALANNTVVKFTTAAVVTPVELSTATKPTGDKEDGKTVILTFNTKLEKAEAENITNYKIAKVDDASKTLAVTKAVYDDTTNTVTLATAPQEDGTNNYEVTVSNLTNLKTDKNKAKFNGVDKVKPVLTEITAINEKTIDLVFNKDVAATQDDQGLSVAIVEKGTANVVQNVNKPSTGNGNKVRVTIGGTNDDKLVAGKTYTVTVKNIKDKATVPNLSDIASLDVTSIADTQAPTLKNVVAKNGASIDLCFDEEVAIAGTLGNNNFIIKKGTETVAVNTLVVTQDPTDKTKVTLVNKNGENPVTIFESGALYTVTVKNDGNTNYVKDLAGNKVIETAYSFTGVVDTGKPQLVSAKMGDADDKVVLTFSEPIKSITNNESNQGKFVVTDATTGVANIVKAVISGNGKDADKVTLTLTNKTEAGKKYRVYISDPSIINDNEVTPNTLDTNYAVALFDGADLTPPALAANNNASLTDAKTIVLTFTEKLDASSVSKDDFTVNDGVITVTEAKVGTGDAANTVTLTLAGNESTGLAQPTIKIAAGQYITDLAGNKLGSADATTLTLQGYADKAAPVLKTAKVIGDKKIELTFSEKVNAINSLDTEDLRNAVLTVPGYKVNSITASGNDAKVIVTVDSSISADPSILLAKGQTAIVDIATNKYAGDEAVVATKDTDAIAAEKAAQKVADAITAINAGNATIQNYSDAEIKGVTAENISNINKAVADAKAAKKSDLIKTEIQKAVDDSIKATQDAQKVADAITAINAGNATVQNYLDAEITGVTAENISNVNKAVADAKVNKKSDLNKTEIQQAVSGI